MMVEANEQQDLASDRFEVMQARVAELERKLQVAENLLAAASEFTFFNRGGGWVEFIKQFWNVEGPVWTLRRRTRQDGDDEWMKGEWKTFEEAFSQAKTAGWLNVLGGQAFAPPPP